MCNEAVPDGWLKGPAVCARTGADGAADNGLDRARGGDGCGDRPVRHQRPLRGPRMAHCICGNCIPALPVHLLPASCLIKHAGFQCYTSALPTSQVRV